MQLTADVMAFQEYDKKMKEVLDEYNFEVQFTEEPQKKFDAAVAWNKDKWTKVDGGCVFHIETKKVMSLCLFLLDVFVLFAGCVQTDAHPVIFLFECFECFFQRLWALQDKCKCMWVGLEQKEATAEGTKKKVREICCDIYGLLQVGLIAGTTMNAQQFIFSFSFFFFHAVARGLDAPYFRQKGQGRQRTQSRDGSFCTTAH